MTAIDAAMKRVCAEANAKLDRIHYEMRLAIGLERRKLLGWEDVHRNMNTGEPLAWAQTMTMFGGQVRGLK